MFSFFKPKNNNSTTIKIGDISIMFDGDDFKLPNISKAFNFTELRSAIGGANASLVKAEVTAKGYKLAS